MTTLEGMTPGTWTLVPAHTEVAFSVRHAGISKVRGVFSDVSGELNVAEDASQSNGQVAVGMNSVDTKNETRDNHVRSAEFFDVEYRVERFRRGRVVALQGIVDDCGDFKKADRPPQKRRHGDLVRRIQDRRTRTAGVHRRTRERQ